jgi:hypothetical protein
MNNHPELVEKWFTTIDWILDKCDRFPKHTRFSFAGRIANASLDALELLSEASYRKEKRALLQNVNLLFERLRLLFRLAYQRKYLSQSQYAFIQSEINAAGRMCGAWLKSCKE